MFPVQSAMRAYSLLVADNGYSTATMVSVTHAMLLACANSSCCERDQTCQLRRVRIGTDMGYVSAGQRGIPDSGGLARR